MEAKPRRRFAPLVGVAAVIGIVLVLVAIASVSNLGSPEWVFNGAFATYSGTGILTSRQPFSYNVTLRVLSFNSTMAHISNSIAFVSQSQSGLADRTYWVTYSHDKAQNPFEPTISPVASFKSNLTLNGKTMVLDSFQYNINTRGLALTAKVYMSKSIFDWPVLVSVITQGNFSDYSIKSNIPGLVP